MATSSTQSADRLVLIEDFNTAVRAAEWERADQLFPELSGILPDNCLQACATLHMQRERWQQAADAMTLIKSQSPESKLHLMLCKNLASLRTYRPEIYRIIADADVKDAYKVHPSASGLPTIALIGENQKLALLCGGSNPKQAAIDLRQKLEPQFKSGEPLGLLSIGDGYILNQLTRTPLPLFLGRKQAIFLFEPDPRLVLATMLIQDFTGAGGPIESANVQWYIGPQWAEQFKVDILTDRFLPYPQITIKAGYNLAPVEQTLQSVLLELGKHDAAAIASINHYYSTLPEDHFEEIFSDSPSRQPRVLLLTTRFSTVLQYSTRDAADAFRQIGCEAVVVIEPTSHHMINKNAIRKIMADFKPDLIFQIDHNRFEHGDLFPPQIPFVNWIQDLLPHLMTIQTGRKIGLRDFVLTPSLQRWVDDFEYPVNQCIEFRKLTRIPQRPLSWASRSNRVVYVSNWSQTPEMMKAELVAGLSGAQLEVMEKVGQKMIGIYQAGQSLTTFGEIRRVLIEQMNLEGIGGNEAIIRKLTTRLFDRLNNLLFRQQGLRWAAKISRENDLQLEIYGLGWEKNIEFSQFARGVVNYGESLEELTRNAGINLVLEPFVCISHQRCLDALAAGGFCLQRYNPAIETIRSVIECLATVSPDIGDAKSLEAALSNDFDRQKLKQAMDNLQSADVATDAVDHVAIVRGLQHSGFLPMSGDILPNIDQVIFKNYEEMRLQMIRFSRDDALRSEIARSQRLAIQSRYSYTAGMKKLIDFLGQQLRHRPLKLEQAA